MSYALIYVEKGCPFADFAIGKDGEKLVFDTIQEAEDYAKKQKNWVEHGLKEVLPLSKLKVF